MRLVSVLCGEVELKLQREPGSEWLWRKRWVCIEMTLCKGLAVKGRLKIVKLELGSRVEGRLFLGEEDMGIPGVRNRGEGTQEAG